jgi:hypothetical protein
MNGLVDVMDDRGAHRTSPRKSSHPFIHQSILFVCGWRRGLKQKPTTVASRGFLLKGFVQQAPTASLITTTGMTTRELIFNM